MKGRRDLLVLTGGVAVSTAGDAAALVALLLRVRPAGSGWVSALLAAELVPIVLLAPIAGRLVDRYETRRVLLTALVGQALLAVPLALVTPAWASVLLLAALGSFTSLVRPATNALVPEITGAVGTTRGYARVATGSGLGWVVGPAAGGLLTGSFGTRAALLVDAGTFVVLALAGVSLRVRRVPTEAARRPGRGHGGFRLLTASPVLRVALGISALAIGAGVVDNVAAPFRFVNQLGLGPTAYGTYLTVWGAGALVGAQVLPRLRPGSEERALAAGNLLCGLGIAGLGLAPNLAVALAVSAVGGCGNGLVNVGQTALVALHTPAERRGTAFAAYGALMQGAVGLGTAAGAPLVAVLHANGALLLAGCLTAAASAAGLARAFRRRPATGATAPGGEVAAARPPAA